MKEITFSIRFNGQVFINYQDRPAAFIGHRAGNVLELAQCQATRTHYARIKRFAAANGLEVGGAAALGLPY